MYWHQSAFRRAMKISFGQPGIPMQHKRKALVMVGGIRFLRGVIGAARRLDDVLYPEWKDQPLEKPVYITGNPRSGTTLLHHMMNLDEQFSTVKLYQTMLPAISLYRLIDRVAETNGWVGARLRRALHYVNRRYFGKWDGIHDVRLQDPEEDEQYFVMGFLSPTLWLLFPYVRELRECSYVDELPADVRHALFDDYEEAIKRHMYETGRDKTFLVKNVNMSGRLASTIERFPDARIVHCIRHPYECIPSTLSMYDTPWSSLAPHARIGSDSYREMARLYMDYFRLRRELTRDLPPEQYAEVHFRDLVRDPKATIEKLYDQLGIPLSDEYRSILGRQVKRADGFKATHSYSWERFGLDRDAFYEEFKDVFDDYGFEP